MEKTMEKIVALAKNRGFVYPGSEIYGGLANTWDYGNLGCTWTQEIVQRRLHTCQWITIDDTHMLISGQFGIKNNRQRSAHQG